MSTVRLRRLQADYDKLLDYVHRHPRVKLVQAQGAPPESYQLEFRLKSLRMKDDQIHVVQDHLVEIHLPRNYPRTPPQCRMLTPIFHPNIAPHAVCIGDHWSAGEPLWSIVARIGEMIAYQSYNTKSPLNGDAARWTTEHIEELPLDATSMIPDEAASDTRWARSAQPTPVARPAAQPTPIAPPVTDQPPLWAQPVRPTQSPQPTTQPTRPAQPTPQPSQWAQPIEPARAITSRPAHPPPPATPIAKSIECPGCHAKLRLPASKPIPRIRCPRCNLVVNVT